MCVGFTVREESTGQIIGLSLLSLAVHVTGHRFHPSHNSRTGQIAETAIRGSCLNSVGA